MSAFSHTEDCDPFSPEKTRNIGHGLTPSKLFEVALRALNTSCLERKPPNQADEAYLREIADDQVTPIDELACQIIESELRRLKTGGQKQTWSPNHGITESSSTL